MFWLVLAGGLALAALAYWAGTSVASWRTPRRDGDRVGGRVASRAEDPHPYVVAYLSGGTRRTLAAALTMLRMSYAIRVDSPREHPELRISDRRTSTSRTSTDRSSLGRSSASRPAAAPPSSGGPANSRTPRGFKTSLGPSPTESDPAAMGLHVAIRGAVGPSGSGRRTDPPMTFARLSADPKVRAALTEVATSARHDGLEIGSIHRIIRAICVALGPVAVLALAIARVGSGGWLPILELVVASVVALVILALSPGSRLTVAGRKALLRLRAKNQHLTAARRPTVTSFRPTTAALAVGLFGSAVLWSAEPALAAALGATRPPTNAEPHSGGSDNGPDFEPVDIDFDPPDAPSGGFDGFYDQL